MTPEMISRLVDFAGLPSVRPGASDYDIVRRCVSRMVGPDAFEPWTVAHRMYVRDPELWETCRESELFNQVLEELALAQHTPHPALTDKPKFRVVELFPPLDAIMIVILILVIYGLALR